jgi:rRNA maturation endonuclease Nob1
MEGNKKQKIQQITCPKCNSENESGLKFCTECGSEIKQTIQSDHSTTCPKCYAEMEPGIRFCTECGTKINRTVSNEQLTTCPQCYTEMEPGIRFCTECGAEIKRTTDQVTTCPQCYVNVEPGLTFCTECGTSLVVNKVTTQAINEELAKRRPKRANGTTPKDETMDNIVESGKGLMKGLGGFLNKAAESIDNTIDKNRQPQSKGIPPEATNPGYLVCDSCGGYYELQSDESADDFDCECECGGNLEHKLTLN